MQPPVKNFAALFGRSKESSYNPTTCTSPCCSRRYKAAGDGAGRALPLRARCDKAPLMHKNDIDGRMESSDGARDHWPVSRRKAPGEGKALRRCSRDSRPTGSCRPTTERAIRRSGCSSIAPPATTACTSSNELLAGWYEPKRFGEVDPFEETASFRRLNKLAVSVLQASTPSIEFGPDGTFFLDLDNGVAIPVDRDQARCRRFRLGLEPNEAGDRPTHGSDVRVKIGVRLHPAVRNVVQDGSGWYAAI